MEYLMTYGWAILIIAVVLGVLFQLGIFSGSALTPRAQPGSCEVLRTAASTSLEGLCQGQLPQYVAGFTSSGYVSAATSNYPLSNGGTVAVWINDYLGGSSCTALLGLSFQSGNSLNVYDPRCYSNVGGTNVYGVSSVPSVCTNLGQAGTTGNYKNRLSQLVITFNSVGFTFYANGTDYASIVYSSSMGSLALAGITAGAGDCAASVGGVNEANFQVYNATLSAAEIKALYLEGVGGAPIRIQNLVGWWPLNGNANDYSGNNNNGQVTGTGVSFNSTWNSQYSPP